MDDECFKHIQRHGIYRSGYEKTIAQQLKAMNVMNWYEVTKIPYLRDGLQREYKPDFVMYDQGGSLVFVEVKGWFKDDDVEKMICVKRFNTDLDIRMITQRNGTAGFTGLKTSEWCEWKEFPCAVGKVPEDWARNMMSPEDFKASGLPRPPGVMVSERVEQTIAYLAMVAAMKRARATT